MASHNDGKLKEFADLMGPFGLEAKSAKEYGLPEPDETGTTFEENAYIKAFAAAKATGLPALSDDFGPDDRRARAARRASTPPTGPRRRTASRDFGVAMQRAEVAMQEVGAIEPGAAQGPLRGGDLPRLAGRRGRIFSRRG